MSDPETIIAYVRKQLDDLHHTSTTADRRGARAKHEMNGERSAYRDVLTQFGVTYTHDPTRCEECAFIREFEFHE